MPSSEQYAGADREDDDEETESSSPPGSPYRDHYRSRPGSVNSRVSNRTPNGLNSRPNSGVNHHGGSSRPFSGVGQQGNRSLSRQAGGQKLTNIQRSNVVIYIIC